MTATQTKTVEAAEPGMVELGDAQRKWVSDFLAAMGDGENALESTEMLSFGSDPVCADAGRTNVQMYDEPDEPENTTLPQAEEGANPVITMVSESGEKFEIRRSYLLEDPRYVDNAAQKMTARPDLVTLEVKAMNFWSPKGTFSVEMSDVRFFKRMPAMRFAMKGGIVYPLDRDGEVTFDEVNTPNIVRFARWVEQEIERRRKIRLTLTKAGFLFQMSLAQLGAALGPPALPKGPSPASMKLPNTKAPIRPTTGQPRTPQKPKAPPQGNPAVSEAEVVAVYRKDPSSIHYTMSSNAHNEIWANLKNTGPAPVAFRVGDKIRVDVQRWPQNKLGEIGLKLRDKPLTTSRQGGTGPSAPEIELANTQPPPPKAPVEPTLPAPQPGAPAASNPANASGARSGNRTGGSQSGTPAAGPQGVEVSLERVQKLADAGGDVFASTSTTSHQQAWNALGREGNAPIAYIVDRYVYVDMARWPKHLKPPAVRAPRGGRKRGSANVRN